MPLLILYILLTINSCSSVVMDDLPRYFIRSIGEGKVEIQYRNGDKYIGNKDMTLGIFVSPQKVIQMGISISRGKFKYKNERPEWCSSGDCYNGQGETINSRSKFIGQFKDFEEYDGKYYLKMKKNKFEVDKRKSRQEIISETIGNTFTLDGSTPPRNKEVEQIEYYDEIFMFDLVKGKSMEPSPEYLSFMKSLETEQKEYQKKQDYEDRLYMERAKRDKEELNQFINKMYSLGARDLRSCTDLCIRYRITQGCSFKCAEAMNINR